MIKAPVSIYDVQSILASSSPDEKTLCTLNAIKQWARFRPIEYKPGGTNYPMGPLTDNQRATVNYGIENIPVWRSGKTIANMTNFWIDGNTAQTNRPNDYEQSLPDSWWTKKLPTSFARIADFVSADSPTTKGYFHSAEPPIGPIALPAVNISANGNLTFDYPRGLSGVSEGLTITYSDLSVMSSYSYQNMYFGVVIKVGSDIYLATQTNHVGPPPTPGVTPPDDSLWVIGANVHIKVNVSSISGALATNGSTAKFFPVICANVKDYSSADIVPISANYQDTFIALLETQQATVNITFAEGVILNWSAYKDAASSNRLIYYSWLIKNPEANVQRTYNMTIQMLDAYGTQLGPSQLRSGVTIDGGDTNTYNGSIDAKPSGDDYYDLVYALRITVDLSATGDQAVFKRSNVDAANVSPSPL